MKTAILLVAALALVEANPATYQKPPKPSGPDYLRDKVIPFPITVNGKKLKTGLVLDNGWFDSKKQITGVFPGT